MVGLFAFPKQGHFYHTRACQSGHEEPPLGIEETLSRRSAEHREVTVQDVRGCPATGAGAGQADEGSPSGGPDFAKAPDQR
jgi:hypothetical protein